MDNEAVIVRISDTSEIKRIMEICDGAFEKSIISRPDFDELSRKIYSYSCFFAARSNGSVAGYAALYANNTDTRIAYLTLIGVRPEYQKRHIGSLLFKACEKTATDNGMNELKLEVRNANTTAQRFYLNHGYHLAGKCSDNSIYMIKSLLG